MREKIIAQGAEAKIILSGSSLREGGRGTFIVKDRISKSYRIPELDKKIRKRRTKAETKLLLKSSKIINCPIPEESKDKTKIKMPFIEGKKLSLYLDKFPFEKQKQICKKIGESIAKLHNKDIIHGDLTTSNMILVENNKKSDLVNSSIRERWAGNGGGFIKSEKNRKQIIYFIDFGLGYFNGKIEDKAVDLHLLKQAIEAKHFENYKILWKSVESGYKKQNNESEKVLERLIAVEKRGRYKK